MSSYEQNLNVSIDYSPNFPNVSQHDVKHTNKISIYHFGGIFEKNSMATRLQCQPDTYTNTTNWQNLLQQQLHKTTQHMLPHLYSFLKAAKCAHSCDDLATHGHVMAVSPVLWKPGYEQNSQLLF